MKIFPFSHSQLGLSKACNTMNIPEIPIVPKSESKQTRTTRISEGITAGIMTVVLLVQRANRMTSRSHDNGEVEEVIFEFDRSGENRRQWVGSAKPQLKTASEGIGDAEKENGVSERAGGPLAQCVGCKFTRLSKKSADAAASSARELSHVYLEAGQRALNFADNSSCTATRFLCNVKIPLQGVPPLFLFQAPVEKDALRKFLFSRSVSHSALSVELSFVLVSMSPRRSSPPPPHPWAD